jgi:hypothetical protein
VTAKYCFDTSAFIEPWNRHYPIDVFPAIWQKLDSLISEGILIAPDEVFQELEKQHDSLLTWVRARKSVFRPLSDIQEAVSHILKDFPTLIDSRSDRPAADPFVIALGMVTETIVVTYEQPDAKAKKPKIPNVCSRFGIQCVSVMELMRNEGWKFL